MARCKPHSGVIWFRTFYVFAGCWLTHCNSSQPVSGWWSIRRFHPMHLWGRTVRLFTCSISHRVSACELFKIRFGKFIDIEKECGFNPKKDTKKRVPFLWHRKTGFLLVFAVSLLPSINFLFLYSLRTACYPPIRKRFPLKFHGSLKLDFGISSVTNEITDAVLHCWKGTPANRLQFCFFIQFA